MQNTETVCRIVEGEITLAVYFETVCLFSLETVEFIFNISPARIEFDMGQSHTLAILNVNLYINLVYAMLNYYYM